jgi:hypothetical protein
MSVATPDNAPFDLRSFARRGPSHRHHIANSHFEQIAWTAHRTPEVMIKVLARGAAQVSAAKESYSIHWPQGKHRDQYG